MKDILKSMLKMLNIGDLIGKLFDFLESAIIGLLGKGEEALKKEIEKLELDDEVKEEVKEEDKTQE